MAVPVAGARRRAPWIGVAAAVALIVAGVVLVPRLLPDRPVPAAPTPEPSTSSATAAPSPSLTGPARADWYRWSQAPDAPIDASDYQRVPAADGVYYVGGETREVAGKEECRLAPVRYVDLTTDQWSELPTLNLPRGWCPEGAMGRRDDLYLLVGKDGEDTVLAGEEANLPAPQLWVHRAAAGAWEQLPSPSAKTGWGNLVGLDDGFVRISTTDDEDGNPLAVEYSWFDYATATWREGEVSDQSPEVLRAAGSFAYFDPVRVDGRLLVLFADWPEGWTAGPMTFTTWDPATNQRVRQTSHELSVEVLQNAQGHLELADPGFVLIGSDSPANPRTRAALVDLRDGTWSELEVPDRDGPISQRYPGAAHWAKPYFATELAGYVVANGYLYNPVTQRWLWVPWRDLTPSDMEVESGDPTVEIAASLRCDWGRPPLGCWRLDVDPLESVAGEFTAAEIAENNRR